MSHPIYLDYMSSTPVDARVFASMAACFQSQVQFGNPNAAHEFGVEAKRLVTTARQQVAGLIHADPEEIIFTSGATEANNLALQGAAQFYQAKGKHLITLASEHDAVLAPLQALQQSGFELTILSPQKNGLIDLEQLKKALRSDTILVSVMHANNEIGVIQPIKEIAKITKNNGTLLHVDAAQSVGKIPVDVRDMGVDLLTCSAHKLYGPKGIGALFKSRKPRIHLKPLMFGGGQENGLRPGTLPTELIVGFGRACEIAQTEMATESQRLLELRLHFLHALAALPDWHCNGCLTARLPGQLSLTFANVHGESLLFALKDLAISQTAACSITKQTSSHVLAAIGLHPIEANQTIRLAFGRFTTTEQVESAAKIITTQVTRLRAMLP